LNTLLPIKKKPGEWDRKVVELLLKNIVGMHCL
jgi:hypothetical protein